MIRRLSGPISVCEIRSLRAGDRGFLHKTKYFEHESIKKNRSASFLFLFEYAI